MTAGSIAGRGSALQEEHVYGMCNHHIPKKSVPYYSSSVPQEYLSICWSYVTHKLMYQATHPEVSTGRIKSCVSTHLCTTHQVLHILSLKDSILRSVWGRQCLCSGLSSRPGKSPRVLESLSPCKAFKDFKDAFKDSALASSVKIIRA